MKLNTGIILHALPFEPEFVSGKPDHKLIFDDVRMLSPKNNIFSEEYLLFAEWGQLRKITGSPPAYIVCVGGGEETADYFITNNITGFVIEGEDPVIIFGILQSIFLRYNQLERSLMEQLMAKAPIQAILNCCSDFFQNHAILFDSELNLIDYSTNYMPGDDDPIWKETLTTRRSARGLLREARKQNRVSDPEIIQGSVLSDLGKKLPSNIMNSFFDSSKRSATLVIADNNKPLHVYQLRLLDHLSDILYPYIISKQSNVVGSYDHLRSVITTLLNKGNIDPIVINKSLSFLNWSVSDDYRLFLISLPNTAKRPDTLTKNLYVYENIFPECVAVKLAEGILLLVHNDTAEIMNECIPKLSKQLLAHKAFCGVSMPFYNIDQVQFQSLLAETALNYGQKEENIRYYKDILTSQIIGKLTTVTPLLPFCHREAVRLFDSDRQNGTELLFTLEVYLRHDRSLKAAAEELFMHRNTMTYRLGVIERLTHMDMDDSHERLHILLSCIVLRSLGGQASQDKSINYRFRESY
jgi:hypothetical protein